MRVLYSNSSSTGYGGFCVEHGGHIANGQWTEQEVQQSFIWCRLRAVRLVQESFTYYEAESPKGT